MPKSKQATASIQELIEGNLKLVVCIANQFSSDPNIIEDLMQEGSIGLYAAAQRFNPKKGASFGTYAAFWIKQKIRRYLQNNRSIIRIPCHQFDKKSVNRKYKEQVSNALNGVFSISDIKDTDENEFDIPDENATIADQTCDVNEFNSILAKLMAEHLDEREWVVLTERFNLDGKLDRPSTLDELGVRFNITRERIRQIEAKALKTLRFQLESTIRGEPELPDEKIIKENSSTRVKKKGRWVKV